MVISNLQICKDWLSLTFSDWQSIQSAIKETNKASTMFHIQFLVEKILKSLIILFGKEAEPSHFPSKQLDHIVDKTTIEIENIERKKWAKLIKEIAILARTIEDERTRPRYGVRHVSGIVSPETLYSMDTIKLFLEDMKAIVKLTIEFFMFLPFSDKLEDQIKLLEGYL